MSSYENTDVIQQYLQQEQPQVPTTNQELYTNVVENSNSPIPDNVHTDGEDMQTLVDPKVNAEIQTELDKDALMYIIDIGKTS